MSDEKSLAAVIRFEAWSPWYISPEEYERIQKDIMARALCGIIQFGDQVLFQILKDRECAYHWAKEQNKARGITPQNPL